MVAFLGVGDLASAAVGMVAFLGVGDLASAAVGMVAFLGVGDLASAAVGMVAFLGVGDLASAAVGMVAFLGVRAVIVLFFNNIVCLSLHVNTWATLATIARCFIGIVLSSVDILGVVDLTLHALVTLYFIVIIRI